MLAVLGIALLSLGLVMPAETTDTIYAGEGVTTETNDVEIKTPTMVVGVGFILAGVLTRDTRANDNFMLLL